MDTSVLVSAFRSQAGASYAFLQLARTPSIQLLVSVALMLEYEAVLLRPEHRQRAGLTLLQASQALDELAIYLEPVRIQKSNRPQLRDPDDELVLDAATNGLAYAIVTHNIADFLPAAHGLSVRVLPPAHILKMEKLR